MVGVGGVGRSLEGGVGIPHQCDFESLYKYIYISINKKSVREERKRKNDVNASGVANSNVKRMWSMMYRAFGSNGWSSLCR